MIVTQTPLRISFAGGGTDFATSTCRRKAGSSSSAIDKYIVIIKERFDDKIRVGYTKTELVDDIGAIEHELVRECLRITGITGASKSPPWATSRRPARDWGRPAR
ncbi:MAG: hypothetical protein R2854_02885 [Caldilineaceae bacterium]